MHKRITIVATLAITLAGTPAVSPASAHVRHKDPIAHIAKAKAGHGSRRVAGPR
jgi:hypothetical protein